MKKYKAVVIDDDVKLSELFKTVLELSGFEASVINDSQKAMAHLKEVRPFLITLDMQMPYVSGIDLLRQIRADESFAESKIVMITASGQVNHYTEIDTGADFVLSKPVGLEQLRSIIQRLVPKDEVAD